MEEEERDEAVVAVESDATLRFVLAGMAGVDVRSACRCGCSCDSGGDSASGHERLRGDVMATDRCARWPSDVSRESE